MKKVMFVCTGNICRSAMAHGILEKLAKDKKKDIQIYSCGTSAKTGDKATFSAIEVAKEYNVNIEMHKATNILETNIEEMDYIFCATKNYKEYIMHLHPEVKNKIYTIKEFINNNLENVDIKDPWGYDIETYRKCCKEIFEYTEKIVDKI